jgi:hypothetical protein
MKTRNLFVICAGLFVAGVLFWPSLYRYDKEEDLETLVRTNRLTGRTGVLILGQWVPQPKWSEPANNSHRELPDEELGKVTGNAAIQGGQFSGKIYNGSTWQVDRLYLLVTAEEPSGKTRWTRRITTSLDAEPLETKFFSVPVTGDDGIGATSWNIERAFGYRRDDMALPKYRRIRGPEGPIDFPVSMSDAEIEQAMRRLYPPKHGDASPKNTTATR